mgnify:CR=1 FL=1
MVNGLEEVSNYCVAARIGNMMEDVLQYEDCVKEAAKSVANQWTHVEAEDLVQNIWVRLLESPGTVDLLRDVDSGAVRPLLIRVARQIAAEDHHKQQVARGDFRYGVNEVRRLLEGGILKGQEDSITSSKWGQTAVRKTGIADSTCLTASAFTDIVDGMVELRKRPGSRYFDLIVRKYVLGDEIKPGPDRNAVSRGLKSLTTIMNRKRKQDLAEHDGPGARRVITNSTARTISRNQYDGGEMTFNPTNGYGTF